MQVDKKKRINKRVKENKDVKVDKDVNKDKNISKSDSLVWRICIGICMVMVTVLVLYLANKDMPIYRQDDAESTYAKGVVTKVYQESIKEDKKTEKMKTGSMKIEVKILTGKYKGEKKDITHNISAMYNVVVSEGDKVSLRIDERNDGDHEVSIYNHYRVNYIVGCLLAFAIILIVVGGLKGLKALLGLIYTMVAIIGVLLPLTIKGYSPILVTIAVVLVGTVVSLYLIDGWTRKTRVAIAGTMGGILVGVLFALVASKIMNITTYQMDEAEALILVMQSTGLKVKNLFLCGILISCMGAVMDVAMSISSSIEEIRTVDMSIESKKLFASAMNIGRDAMGTMANTLILAFTGSSFNMILLLYSYGISFQQLLNTDFIAVEIISAIAGSIGIICSVPLVAFIGAYIPKKTVK